MKAVENASSDTTAPIATGPAVVPGPPYSRLAVSVAVCERAPWRTVIRTR